MSRRRVALAGLLAAVLLTVTAGPAAAEQVADNWRDGPWALGSLTSGGQNTGVGLNAFAATTTQENNTGLGYGAGKTSTGHANTALGSAAMFEAGSGSMNVAVGLHAGRYLTGSRNVLLGADTRGTVANGSVAIGWQASALHDDAVAIGANTVTVAPHEVTVGPRDLAAAALILISPSGARFRVTVDDEGNLTTRSTP